MKYGLRKDQYNIKKDRVEMFSSYSKDRFGHKNKLNSVMEIIHVQPVFFKHYILVILTHGILFQV